jgi:hypothetical protein
VSTKTEVHDQSEGHFAASDADTPPEVLECLAGEPSVRYFVASNPHAPIAILERLTQSDVDAPTQKAAEENIAKQRAENQ